LTVTPSAISASFIEAIDRGKRRTWSSAYDGEPLERQVAVEHVSRVLMEQRQSPLPSAGPGVDFALAMYCFDDFFSAIPPSDEELAEAIARSETDFYADQAVSLMLMLTRSRPIAALTAWENRRYLGQSSPPHKPPGSTRYRNLQRDTLIAGQIRELTNVGFKPTRNDATSGRNSGCDIVVDALKHNGLSMSYPAVEAIWKKAQRSPRLDQIAALLIEGLLGETSGGASE
jgi:hypothetical protein